MATTPALEGTPHAAAGAEAREEGTCLHCGLPLTAGIGPADGPFCCRGCRTVYGLLQAEGLERYYDLRPDRGVPAAALRPDSFAWLDRLVAEQGTLVSGAETTAESQNLWRLTLDIQGIHCAACVWLLEELFRREAGGVDLRINPSLGRVEVVWDSRRGDLKRYLREVERFGYRLGPVTDQAPRGSRSLLVRMAVSIAAALNVMMFALSFYFGLAPADGLLYPVFGWLIWGLATVSVVVGGPVFFRGAVAGLRRRVAHLDLPISVGMVLAYAGSSYAFFTAGPEAAYFDSLTVFVALMLVGRWAQEHVLERNRNALLTDGGAEQLTTKRLETDGFPVPVAAGEVLSGDELWIAPGDIVPVDGVLLRRPVEVALDWITGESDPVAFTPGATVPAGAYNAGGRGFSVTAVEPFATSRLRDLLRSPGGEDATPRPDWWHRISRIYVVAVLLVAALGFGLWAGRDLALALRVTVAVLVVTCPCALGLATPLAAELVHHALRRRGVFLRKASFLDRALRVRKVLLDKTGTLTLGELVLTPEGAAALTTLVHGERAMLAAMVSRSNHPVSRSLHRALTGSDAGGAMDDAGAVDRVAAAEALREEAGRGLVLRHEGHEWRLGRAAFALGGAAGDAIADTGENHESTTTPGDTVAVFARGGREIARFTFAEEFRPDAQAEAAELQAGGFELHLLSGDAPARVAAAAAHLGIPPANVRAGLSPEAKAARVRELDAGDTLMVGDGINDGPSFAAATCAATPAVDRPVLPGRADFYFLGDGIAALRRALMAARRLRRVVRDNLIIAALYNLGVVSLSLAGLVTPVLAAVLMPASSLGIVVLTVFRLTGRRTAWI